ncbi:MAG TPA: alanine racemase [Actinomycetota bacterium]|nr:alanine racemase [Actinomycetota bacterium]
MVDGTYRSTWCEVDLPQFRTNLGRLQEAAGTSCLLVVKANAYGHGMRRIAKEAVRAGISMLGVATIGEAQELLHEDVPVPILIMCALDPDEIEYCVANGVDFFAWRVDQFQSALAAARRYGRAPRIHVEVDTGMSRSGVRPRSFSGLLDDVLPAAEESIVGLATHFMGADLEDTRVAGDQLKQFLECARVASARGLRPLLHTANSPATIRLPESRMGMVRLGVAAYGLAPSEHTPLLTDMGPILSWKATVTNVKDAEPGDGVGYGWLYVAEEARTVATLAAGYADGFRRSPLQVNTVLFDGRETPVIGSVFMDQCVILVPEGVRCGLGDEAVLLGAQKGASLAAETLAERWGTNNYDVVAGIRSRVPRRYIGD